MGETRVSRRVLAAGLVVTAIGCSEPGSYSSYSYKDPDDLARPAADNPYFGMWCRQAEIILYELYDGVAFREYEIRLGDAADRLARIVPNLDDARVGTWRLIRAVRRIVASTHTTMNELHEATAKINGFSLARDVEACKSQGAISE